MFIGKAFSYILKQSKFAKKDIINFRKYPLDIYKGAKYAKRLSRIRDCNILQSSALQSKSLMKQTNKHLPGMLAIASTLIPVPGTGAIGYSVGKGLQKLFLLV